MYLAPKTSKWKFGWYDITQFLEKKTKSKQKQKQKQCKNTNIVMETPKTCSWFLTTYLIHSFLVSIHCDRPFGTLPSVIKRYNHFNFTGPQLFNLLPPELKSFETDAENKVLAFKNKLDFQTNQRYMAFRDLHQQTPWGTKFITWNELLFTLNFKNVFIMTNHCFIYFINLTYLINIVFTDFSHMTLSTL